MRTFARKLEYYEKRRTLFAVAEREISQRSGRCDRVNQPASHPISAERNRAFRERFARRVLRVYSHDQKRLGRGQENSGRGIWTGDNGQWTGDDGIERGGETGLVRTHLLSGRAD